MESIFTPKGVINYNTSAEAIRAIAGLYGSVDYSRWTDIRRPWYSKVNYPEAGQSQLVFFSQPSGAGGVTTDDTNIPKANSFGQQHVIIRSIQCFLFIKVWNLYAWD